MSLTGSGTLIGRSVTIRGEVSGSEDLYIDGTVEGMITLTSGKVTVGPNAQIKADIQTPGLVVLGVLEGNIHSEGRVEIRDKASLVGDISAVRLVIEEGATLRGTIDLQGPSSEKTFPTETPSTESSSLF